MDEKLTTIGNSRWISIAAWSIVALVFFGYFLAVLQLDFSQMLVPCQGFDCHFLALSNAEVTVLTSWALSPHTYAYFISAVAVIVSLVYWFLGGLIVWRQGNTRVGLAVSLALIIIPISTLGGSTDWAANYPRLVIPGVFLNIFGTVIVLVFFYLVPNGRFSPGWAYIPLAITILLVAILTMQVNGFIALSDNSFSLFATTILGLVILGGVFHIYRYRAESTQVERQQTKWILFGVLAYILAVVLWALIFGGALSIPAGKARLLAMVIGWFSINLILLGFPFAITIAILRYRLWDIDLVIRRTLQYALLTGLLALTYFGGVVLFQGILRPLTGSADSPLVTVITTLGIAALFNPLRRRIQDFIDRRFYRAKYDAERNLARFAAVARDEVAMERLTAALLAVVDETVQPEKTSVWLKKR